MSLTDWEEVRRLANDFQKVQQGSTTQRLSERNCIEIVTNLMKMKLLDVVYTTDGKEYLTPQHLIREIRDEIIVNGGRVNIVDIAQSLSVDLSHVENAVKDIVKSDSSLQFTLGQVLNGEYLASLADDMNERLQEKGVVNVSDLTVTFDLPAEFLMSVVNDNMGSRIHGQRDPTNPRVILTDWLIARHRAVLRGALNAACRPVAIQSLVKEYGLNERITAMVVEELIQMGEVTGGLSGQARRDKATFVPHVYISAQNDWIDAFLKSNSYIPYDAVKKLDIADPKVFLKTRYSPADFLFLESALFPKTNLDRIEGGIEDVLSSGTWTETSTLFPSGIDEKDCEEVLNSLLSTQKFKGVRVVERNFIVSENMFEESKKRFEQRIEQVAEEEATKHAAILVASPSKSNVNQDDDDAESTVSSRKSRKDDRQKKKDTGKNVAPAGKAKKEENAKLSGAVPDFLSTGAIVVELQKLHEDAPYELLNAVAESIQPGLVLQYRRVLDAKAKTIIASSTVDQSDKKQLNKHLLRNIGAEILNPLLLFIIDDLGLPQPSNTELTYESRTRLISKMPEPYKSSVEKVNAASSGDDIAAFEDALAALLENESLGMSVKKADKKREALICQEHRQQLLQGISTAKDIGTALRFCSLGLFLKHTGFPLDAPGKFVSQIISVIKSHLSTEQLEVLEQCRDKLQTGASTVELEEFILKLKSFL